jgi:hypothetical protein
MSNIYYYIKFITVSAEMMLPSFLLILYRRIIYKNRLQDSDIGHRISTVYKERKHVFVL